MNKITDFAEYSTSVGKTPPFKAPELPSTLEVSEEAAGEDAIGEVGVSALLPAELLLGISTKQRGILSEFRDACSLLAPSEARRQDEELDRRAATLTRSFYRMLRLTAGIGALSQLAGGGGFQLIDGDVVELTREICSGATEHFALCGVRLHFDSQITARKIAINPVWYERALLNLLSNALGATEDGDIVLVRITDDSKAVRITVSDTGRGIPAERLDRLFELNSTPQPLNAPARLLALGLPLCRLIAEGHGGTLHAERNATRGTTVTLTLPDNHSKLAFFREMGYDYAGGYDHTLLELSDALPITAFMHPYLE